MTNFPFDIVGFDLDGTLFDTSADLAAATNHALALAGRPLLSLDAVKSMLGRGAKHMLEQGLEASGGYDAETMSRVYPELLDYYDANLTRGTVAFPGLMAALDDLDSRSVKVAIVTNKFERFATKLVAQLGLDHRFACVIGGDTMGKGNAKPSAAPIHEMIARCGGGRAAFVGDSIYDIQAAKNAGIPSIAVSFGFLMQPVEELGADAVIDGYDELVPALIQLGGAC
ncbi:HAD family hydrolase [Sphingomonas koreensis]|jgi:phosphoglycolate phosphatase|uniref:phosphoglycolate phosphatase n=1 Tax=Sphingomonas koreensis TaxID=93064 RepID=A0A1L6JDW5_9SPHN|nr:HAD-IA family hydrolase [Sphingomonas koreensis]APR54109.1 phosphoglycolate phosphatase [Sphingomonas koreensis]MDC7809091.1 HAD-IA family hydrolase [Sphingomonas koreensis]RSU18745.1 HAD family hydrolase [Sphingomonas koreensis]RSU25521.1 HAD family hydrolase [Sphingomonas koreensis]RSU25744.1 HAD family hydrolase [Sphingomonas koreensis]